MGRTRNVSAPQGHGERGTSRAGRRQLARPQQPPLPQRLRPAHRGHASDQPHHQRTSGWTYSGCLPIPTVKNLEVWVFNEIFPYTECVFVMLTWDMSKYFRSILKRKKRYSKAHWAFIEVRPAWGRGAVLGFGVHEHGHLAKGGCKSPAPPLHLSTAQDCGQSSPKAHLSSASRCSVLPRTRSPRTAQPRPSAVPLDSN